jgi:probable addiction module antidote protein
MAKGKSLDLAPFDASDYLDSEDVIAEYLAVALEDPDPEAFLAAVCDVAKARGMTEVAAKAGLGRESLYKALRAGAHPRFDTVRRLLTALGVRLDVVVAASKRKGL